MLLDKRAEVDAKDVRGDTPLTLADRGNHTEVLELLEGRAPWVRWADVRGDSPLLRAARSGRWARVAELAAGGAGAMAATRGADGESPLLLAARAGLPARDALAAMLRGGGGCNETEMSRALESAGDGDAVWALATAAPRLVGGPAGQAALRSAARTCRQDALAALVNAGADPVVPDRGNLLLQAAARAGDARCLEFMIKSFTYPWETDLERMLDATDSADVVKLLAQLDAAGVRAAREAGALRRAVGDGRCAAAGAMLEAGSPGGAGAALLEEAARGGQAQCARALRQHGAPALAAPQWEEALRQAATDGRHAQVAALLAAGVNPNATGSNGHTALTLASKEGRLWCVEELLRHGADKEARVASFHGTTPLVLASNAGHLEVVKALLEAGADKEARDSTWGATALHWAGNNNHLQVVSTLLAAGADVNSVRPDGLTALMHPAERGYKDMVQLLIKNGINLKARNKYNNRTALEWAQQNNKAEVVEIIKAAGG